MTLADRDALFAGVLASPDDDLPRLVFADHLEESGHPALVARAAYIRAQLDAESAPEPARLDLARHAAALRGQFRDEADAVLDPHPRPGVYATRTRGFVSDLRGSALSLRTHAAALFAAAPVTGLHFDVFDTHTDWVRSALYLRGVTRLKLGPAAWPGGHSFTRVRNPAGGHQTVVIEAEPLVESRHFRGVERLDLSRNQIGDLWLLWFLPRLAGAPIGRRLAVIDLSHNALGDSAAALLSSARGLDGLTRLELAGNPFTDAGRAVLRQRFGDRVGL